MESQKLVRLSYPDRHFYFDYDTLAEYVANVYVEGIRGVEEPFGQLRNDIYELYQLDSYELFDYMKNSMDWKDISHLVIMEESRDETYNYHELYRSANLEVLE